MNRSNAVPFVVRPAIALVCLVSSAAAATWQNPVATRDIDGSGIISPRDALIDINYLNSNGATPVPGSGSPPPYYDVNGDDLISPVDPLLVVNYLVLNSGSAAPPGAPGSDPLGVPQVAIDLVVTDTGGVPVSVATVGQNLELRVIAGDLRVPPPAFAGVYTATADIAYTAGNVTINPSFVYAPDFFADSLADTGTPGTIGGANGVRTSGSAPGSSPQLMFRIPFVATNAGLATFFSGPAGPSELHDVLLYGDDNRVSLNQILFGSAELTIVPEPSSIVVAACGFLALLVLRRRARPCMMIH